MSEAYFRLRLHCERCGGRRSDGSKRFCGPCYKREKPEEDRRSVYAFMVISPWKELPDGTRKRTVTGT